MPLLSFTLGPLAGQSIEVGDKPVVLGRGSAADISLNDGAASGRHAEIAVKDGGWVISDLDSVQL